MTKEAITLPEARKTVGRAQEEAKKATPRPWSVDYRRTVSDSQQSEDAALVVAMRACWEPMLAEIMREIVSRERARRKRG